MRPTIASLVVLTFLTLSLVYAVPAALASSPSSGTITTTNTSVAWTGMANTANPTVGLVTSFDPSTCQSLGYCDLFTLNLDIPSDLAATNPGYYLNITMTWANAEYDYDLYVYYNDTQVGASTLGAGTNYENVFLSQPHAGTYQIYADNWLVPPEVSYNGVAVLGLKAPPYVFNTRTASYNVDSAGKSAGTPFTFTNDLNLVGAQNGQCVVFCAQDVEPSIKIDQFGTIYASAIEGVPGGTDFWRSTDGGNSFQYLGQPDGAQSAIVSQNEIGGLGGGDDDLVVGSPFVLLNQSSNQVINSTGRVYLSSLWLGSVTVSNSIDQGNTWLVSQTTFPVDDRQWTAAMGSSTYYVSFNELVSEVGGVTNLAILQSNDGGLTYANGAYIGKALGSNLSNFQGPIEIAPDGTIYAIFTPPSTNQLMLGKCAAPCNLPPLPLSTTSSPFTVTPIFNGPSNMSTDNVFPQLSIDSAGNLFVSWSDGHGIYMIGSSDGGDSWTLPVKVNTGSATATALEPWMQAGDPGRVGVMWYGTNVTSNSPDNFTAYADAQWKVFYSFTPDALSASPTFYQVVASGGSDLPNGVVHTGPICTEGTACPSGTRNLAEYSSFTVDANGFVNMVFSQDQNTPDGLAQVDYVRQTAGPNFIAPALGTATGSGHFTPSGSNSKDHFGFRVQSTQNGLTGSLSYMDSGSNLLFTSTSLYSFSISGTEATFSGFGTLKDGRSSVTLSFTVQVIGDQKPAIGEDYFSITLSNGYKASGYISGGQIVVTGSA